MRRTPCSSALAHAMATAVAAVLAVATVCVIPPARSAVLVSWCLCFRSRFGQVVPKVCLLGGLRTVGLLTHDGQRREESELFE